MKIETPYYTITPESIARERERLFEKARHDEAQALRHAKQEGRTENQAEVVRNALRLHLPVDTIRQLTGLSDAEIEELGQQL